ncbi:hypothetical protein L2E82_31224 [Cichorium intybus]|uniref:Uncharacterized protein n=1 Tax=Cichorium intybus TaxID=13427 RepID=A0ACB9D2Q3_CICIN|nr:hypothetical protein L2E82_31224 [Cichorium intybus]
MENMVEPEKKIGSRTKINDEVNVDVAGKLYRVGVVEVDIEWHPFFIGASDDADYSDVEDEEEEDEGISDTWEPRNDQVEDMEEGEIAQDENDPVVGEEVPTGADNQIRAAIGSGNEGLQNVTGGGSKGFENVNVHENLGGEFMLGTGHIGHSSFAAHPHMMGLSNAPGQTSGGPFCFASMPSTSGPLRFDTGGSKLKRRRVSRASRSPISSSP